MAEFHIRVRLAEPLRDGAGEFLDVITPVANIGELVDVLERTVPSFDAHRDELFNFAVNGNLPWRLMGFLEDAYLRGVLRRTGAEYQFRHARLQEHLSTRYRR